MHATVYIIYVVIKKLEIILIIVKLNVAYLPVLHVIYSVFVKLNVDVPLNSFP